MKIKGLYLCRWIEDFSRTIKEEFKIIVNKIKILKIQKDSLSKKEKLKEKPLEMKMIDGKILKNLKSWKPFRVFSLLQ